MGEAGEKGRWFASARRGMLAWREAVATVAGDWEGECDGSEVGGVEGASTGDCEQRGGLVGVLGVFKVVMPWSSMGGGGGVEEGPEEGAKEMRVRAMMVTAQRAGEVSVTTIVPTSGITS